MKRIGIDARLYFQTGVGTYLRNFLSNLQKIAPRNIQFVIYVMENESSKINFSAPNFIKRKVPYRWHSLSEQVGFLKILYQDNLNLMHFTYFSYPILYGRRFITTIHDTTPLFFRTGKASTKNPFAYEIKHKVFKTVVKTQIKNALKIITPTKTVKRQLVSLYGHSYGEKIIPIYEGVDRTLQKAAENKELSKTFKQPFFLYVGNFYPHKNVEKLIKAFSNIEYSYQLVLVGPDDYFSKRLLKLVQELKQENKIIFYHNATPADLKFFYTEAQALIHPSLSEGFGLPLLEASFCSCPVIGSNIKVFKELMNDEYLSFDPHNVRDIKKKIHQFIAKRPMFDYKHILSQFSFEEMTKKTLDVYTSCL